MKPKHTPGPWNIDWEVSEDGPAIAGADNFVFVLLQGESATRSKANAHLIAASPEMFGLLLRLRNAYGHLMIETDIQCLNHAIAKAEGRKS